MGVGCGAVEAIAVCVSGGFGGAGARRGEGAVLGFFYCLYEEGEVSVAEAEDGERRNGSILRSILSKDLSPCPSAVSVPCDPCKSFGGLEQRRTLGAATACHLEDLG